MKSLQELERIKEISLKNIGYRADDAHSYMHQVLICACSENERFNELKTAFVEESEKNGLAGKVQIERIDRLADCPAPFVLVYPEGALYTDLTPADVTRVCKEHLAGGEVVSEFLLGYCTEDGKVSQIQELPYYFKDESIALRLYGKINAENILEYIANDGYCALGKALLEMSPMDVVNEVKASGLRGRGGGGFSAGLKWEFTYKAEGDTKYVVCNADEGDPGAFMDRYTGM